VTDINSVVVCGHITRDLEGNAFAYTPNGQARANISIAVNRSRKQGEQWVDEVSYFDVTIWGKTAENLKPYLTKGAQIVVSGHLQQDRWEKEGQKFSKVGIVADSVQLCGKRESTTPPDYPGFKPKVETSNYNPAEGFDEDVPF